MLGLARVQIDLRILPTKIFFFQTSTVAVFLPFLKCHVVFQDQSEDYIGEEDIVDMTEVIVL